MPSDAFYPIQVAMHLFRSIWIGCTANNNISTTSTIKIESQAHLHTHTYTRPPNIEAFCSKHFICTRSLQIVAHFGFLFGMKTAQPARERAFALSTNERSVQRVPVHCTTMNGLFNENKLDCAGCVSLFRTPRSMFFIIIITIFYNFLWMIRSVCAFVCVRVFAVLFTINFPSIPVPYIARLHGK